jgi:alpha-L-rhamnosidase
VTPYALRVEHLEQPLGLYTTAPRLSWRLPVGVREQRAYRIRTDNGWDTGGVDGAPSVLVTYEGPALRSAERVSWQVKVWTDAGESDWSEPARFEMGLLSPDDWTARWIEPAEPLLRTTFTGRPTRLHLTAHGIYEAFVNGERVGDAELTPGFTQYASRLQVQTYDIAPLVLHGENVLAVILSDGWFKGQTGALRATDQWGTTVALLAQLDDGVLGPWKCARGHLRSADLIAGQSVDLRALPVGWTEPAFDDSGWADAVSADRGYATLVGSPAPPVRRVEEIVPVAVTRPSPGRQVVDLGQNINGWLRLGRLGPAGTRIVLTHGEHLDAAGELTSDHLRPAFPFLPAPLPAGMVDEVVSAGRPGESFEPRHTTHGFRYVQVEGHPDELTTDDVRGVVVHTDLRRTGWFSCSDPRIDRLHEAARWGLRGNVCDIPTDCPHRERAGWTGDWQLFVPTAAFLYDVAGFSTKWLRDVAADQWADGTVANISPCPPAEGQYSPMARLNGSAGWGDAVVIVPWELYRAYGDERILAEMWPAMVSWMDRTERMADSFLWNTGFHWGEWLVPDEEPLPFEAFLTADRSDVATAYFAHSARLMARIAAVLGRTGDAARYRTLAENVADAWRRAFLDATGRLTPGNQANYVRSLAFDLIPESLRPAVANRLVELIRAAGNHLGTGFLATPYLLEVLADNGHAEVAFDLLCQDTEPSWLVMVDRGATTMWEHWNGVDADGVAHDSLNHYAKGAVVSFLHRYVAGLSPLEPAYRRFRVRLTPGGGLTWAQTAHESPYGRIEVGWELAGRDLIWTVTVPPGTSAELILPGGAARTLGPGHHIGEASARPAPVTNSSTGW